jgi:hypothetical protein
VLALLVNSHTSSTSYVVGEKVHLVGASNDEGKFSRVLTFYGLLV